MGHVAVKYDFTVADEIKVLLGVEFLVPLSNDCIEQLLRMIWWDQGVLFAVDEEHGTPHRFHVLKIIVMGSYEECQKRSCYIRSGLLDRREWAHQYKTPRFIHSGQHLELKTQTQQDI